MKDEDIFDIIDGIASEETVRLHESLLIESPDYQALFREYTQTHTLLMGTSMEKTAVNFTDKLIDRWELSQETVVAHQPSKLPFYFLIAGSVIFILLMVLILPIINNSNNQIDLTKPLGFLQDKVFVRSALIINALVGLIYIDRRFLKPYFERKLGVLE